MGALNLLEIAAGSGAISEDLVSKSNVNIASLGTSQIAAQFDTAGLYTLTNFWGVLTWVEILGQGRYRLPRSMNFGVSGDTSSPSTSGPTPGFTSRVQSVIDSGAKICIISDPTNDFDNADVTVQTGTSATMQSIFEQLTVKGITVITWVPLPRGSARVLSADGLKRQQLYTNWLRAYARQNPRVVLIDGTAQFYDSSLSGFQPLSGVTYDGLHFSISGAQLYASLIKTALDKLTSPFSPLSGNNADVFDATINTRGNLLANAMMTGSVATTTPLGGATVSGNYPTSWTPLITNGTGLTVAYSKVGNLAQVTVSGTPTAGAPQVGFLQSAVGGGSGAAYAAKLSPGDVLESYLYVEVDASSSGVSGLRWRNQLTDSVGTRGAYIGDNSSGLGTLGASAFTGLLRTEPVTVSTSPTDGLASLVAMGQQNVPFSITYRIGQATLRKVF